MLYCLVINIADYAEFAFLDKPFLQLFDREYSNAGMFCAIYFCVTTLYTRCSSALSLFCNPYIIISEYK